MAHQLPLPRINGVLMRAVEKAWHAMSADVTRLERNAGRAGGAPRAIYDARGLKVSKQ